MEIHVEDRAGERLDAYLAVRLAELSRSRIQTLIREQFIQVNGHPAKPRDAVKMGDFITIALPEAVPLDAAPQDLPLTILHEDNEFIVLDKAPGMVVHPAAGHAGGTLVNALLHHCRDLSGIGGVLRPGIVHRLVKETSGLLVVAKSDEAHWGLAGQFKRREVRKTYQALVYGEPKMDGGRIEAAVGRHPTDRKRMSTQSRRGRSAVT